jgi:hypothetical protein
MQAPFRTSPFLTTKANPCLLALLTSLAINNSAIAAEGKLLATSGVTQVEGSGGGGIVPWATLAGYGSRDEIGAAAFASTVDVADYRLQSLGAGVGIYDRVELSVAQQTFDIDAAAVEIRQNILGIKARIHGDVVYGKCPQISAGIQYKNLVDETIADAVGADNSKQGTDFYVSGTRVFLGALGGYNALANLTLRATKANQMGLLGYGGDKNDGYKIQAETSLAVLFGRHVAVGVEYRQKPDNLSYAEEDDWKDIFIAYVPSKQFSLTAAWVDLGSIAGEDDQTGVYLSLTGNLL